MQTLLSLTVTRAEEVVGSETLRMFRMDITNPIHGTISAEIVLGDEAVAALGSEEIANQDAISALNRACHEEMERRTMEAILI